VTTTVGSHIRVHNFDPCINRMYILYFAVDDFGDINDCSRLGVVKIKAELRRQQPFNVVYYHLENASKVHREYKQYSLGSSEPGQQLESRKAAENSPSDNMLHVECISMGSLEQMIGMDITFRKHNLEGWICK